MSSIIYNLVDWSEVWALIIPFLFIFPVHKLQKWQKPVIAYIIIAFFLNLLSSCIANSYYLPFNVPWKNNVIVYNIHSIVRFACFSYFFILLKQKHYTLIKRMIPLCYVLFFFINFMFFDNFFYTGNISGNLLTIESYLLLIYCLLYFLALLKEEQAIMDKGPQWWIIIGISIYVAINFFLFLFYVPMVRENEALADNMWTMHNIAYIILCLFIARAFYSVKKVKA